ncbi:hypothetical protein [Paraglaciecola chathamensis]|uniref:Lipoprotein n=1 Tax=Paraglaciecola chathamensis S18K6 TaxID=1127672 RepID=A0AAV3USP2_9ALTE|nr:hypothetical protein [Paraglaciecola chathamensis]GAC08213.1 hypothetical protein GCHA_0248 [Paraglaciecola chathamensis S18K6]
MKLFHFFGATFALLTVVSCKSTGVVPLGQDSYYLGKKDSSLGVGVSLENKAEVYREASLFCSSKGLEMKIIKETVTSSIPGRLGSTEIEFSCIEKGSLETPTDTKPDQIIETRSKRLGS